jgi:hypothetical protein
MPALKSPRSLEGEGVGKTSASSGPCQLMMFAGDATEPAGGGGAMEVV